MLQTVHVFEPGLLLALLPLGAVRSSSLFARVSLLHICCLSAVPEVVSLEPSGLLAVYVAVAVAVVVVVAAVAADTIAFPSRQYICASPQSFYLYPFPLALHALFFPGPVSAAAAAAVAFAPPPVSVLAVVVVVVSQLPSAGRRVLGV